MTPPRHPETLTSETLTSETLTSETLTSETLASETQASAAQASRTPGRPDEVVSHRFTHELAGRRRRRRRRVLLAGLVVCALLGAAVFVVMGPVLVVRHVAVTGTDRTTPAQVRTASGLSAGDRLIGADPAAVAHRVTAALPTVSRATVSRGLTGTVTVHVAERTAVARTSVAGAERLLSADGTDFAAAGPRDTALPQVTGGSGRALVAALGVAAALPADVRSTTTLQVAADGRLSLVLPRTITVVWGRPGSADDGERERALAVMLAHPERLPNGSSLDLSVPGVVTVR